MPAGDWWESCTPVEVGPEGLLALCSCMADVRALTGDVLLYGKGCRKDVPALPTRMTAETLAWVAAAEVQVGVE